MREVTQITAQALLANRSHSIGNTSTDGYTLWLHSNAIAKNGDKGGCSKLEISFAGWCTAVTQERINGVLELAGTSYRVVRKNGCLHLKKRNDNRSFELDAHKWYSIDDFDKLFQGE